MSEPRTPTALMQALFNAYRLDAPAACELQPGDHKAIAKLQQILEWLKTDERAAARFNEHVAAKRARAS